MGVLEELPRNFTGGEDWSPDQYRLPELLERVLKGQDLAALAAKKPS